MSSHIIKIAQTAREIFDSYDKNNDGSISKKEIKPLLEKISKQLNLPIPNDDDIEEGFKQLDNNQNDKLEFEEFFAFYKQIYEQLIH
jgi:Ca2+-binding EF-hand superfamily protein